MVHRGTEHAGAARLVLRLNGVTSSFCDAPLAFLIRLGAAEYLGANTRRERCAPTCAPNSVAPAEIRTNTVRRERSGSPRNLSLPLGSARSCWDGRAGLCRHSVSLTRMCVAAAVEVLVGSH